MKYTLYLAATGKILFSLDGEKPTAFALRNGELNYVVGDHNGADYFIDITYTQSVPVALRDHNKQPLVDPVTLFYIAEDYTQHIPTLKTAGPWSDNYNYTIGGADLVIAVPNPTRVTIEFNGDPVQTGEITDGTLEFSAAVAGDYTIILDAVPHLKKSITVTVA